MHKKLIKTIRTRKGKPLLLPLLLPLIPLAISCQSPPCTDQIPPGNFVEVNQKKVYIRNEGVGSPAVVFESGMSGWSVDWALVQPEVSKKTQTISYDRMGYGSSEESQKPRTIQTITEELHSLLGKSGIQKKYILVGHSLGGLYVQYYARRYPNEVAGVVLVDSVNRQQSRLMPKAMREKYEGGLLSLTALASKLAPWGVLRLFNQPSSVILKKLPESDQPLARCLAFRAPSYRTMAQEMAHFQESQISVDPLGPWPSIPAAVISSGKIQDFPPGFQGEEMKAFWDQMQENLAVELKAKKMRSQSSGHYVHLDDPRLVTHAILEMVDEVQKNGSP